MNPSELEERYQQLINDGIAPSTARAHQEDRKRFWDYCLKEHGVEPSYPVPIQLVLNYILDNISDSDGSNILKVSTVKRYVASVSVEQQAHGHDSLLSNPKIKILFRRAKRALPNQYPQKKRPITAAVLKKLLDTCDDTLRGVRNKAILSVGFAGGRRRSELVKLKVEDISKTDNGYTLTLKKSKTDKHCKGMKVPLTGFAALALKTWLIRSGIRESYVFRGIMPDNRIKQSPISGSSINNIIKGCIQKAGLNKEEYSAHSLRSGFMTEAINQGISLQEAMQLSGHKDMKVAHGYYRETELENNRATSLII